MQPTIEPEKSIDIRKLANREAEYIKSSSDETLRAEVIKRTDVENKRRSRSKRDPKSRSQELLGKQNDKAEK